MLRQFNSTIVFYGGTYVPFIISILFKIHKYEYETCFGRGCKVQRKCATSFE